MNPLDDMLCVDSIKKIMEIFGGKWSFVIIGELHTGTKRFNELSRKLGISTKSLSDALKSLEASGIITLKAEEGDAEAGSAARVACLRYSPQEKVRPT